MKHKSDCETICRPLKDDSNCDCGVIMSQYATPEEKLEMYEQAFSQAIESSDSMSDSMIVAYDDDGKPLRVGDEIEFQYNGLIETNGELQRGKIEIEPTVRWRGGTCPLERWTSNVVKVDNT